MHLIVFTHITLKASTLLGILSPNLRVLGGLGNLLLKALGRMWKEVQKTLNKTHTEAENNK